MSIFVGVVLNTALVEVVHIETASSRERLMTGLAMNFVGPDIEEGMKIALLDSNNCDRAYGEIRTLLRTRPIAAAEKYLRPEWDYVLTIKEQR